MWCMNTLINSTTSGRPLWQINILCDFSFIHFPYTCLIKWRPWLNQERTSKKTPLRKKSPYLEVFWSAFFPHFSAFRLNTERYKRIQSECGKIREKCGPEYLRIRTLFTQFTIERYIFLNHSFTLSYKLKLVIEWIVEWYFVKQR